MSVPPYSKYRDSNVAGLGAVPSHWSVKRLKNLCSVSPSNVDKHSYDNERAVLLCNYTDVYYNELITRDLPFMVATASADQIRKFTLRAGDTIITKDSETADDIAISAYVPQDLEGVICGYHLSVVRPREGVCGSFIKRIFDSAYAKAYFEVAANGLTRVGLSQYAIDNLALPAPPHDEQVAVARFLDQETTKIDGLIAEQQRLIDLLHEKRQALISHAVTKGLNPDASLKRSGVEWLGDVPVSWTARRIGSLFKQQKRQGFLDRSVLSVYRDYGVVPKDSRDDNFNKTPEDLSSYQLVKPNDLVINKMKAWQGSLGVSALEGITSPDYVVFSPNHSEGSEYLHYLLRCQAMVSVYRSISNGIRPAQWRLEPDVFLSLTVFVPTLAEQQTIVDFIKVQTSAIDALVAEAERAISFLLERRTGLISAAVTGKIDVRGIEDAKTTPKRVAAA